MDKKYFNITAGLLLFVASILISTLGCKEVNHESYSPSKGSAYILLDYTEGQEYDIPFDRVESWGRDLGIKFNNLQIMPIRDYSFSGYDLIYLTSKEDAHGSSYVEKLNAEDATKKGIKELSEIVDGYNSKYSGVELSKSSIVNPLCDCLKKSSPNDVVFLFSDILENDFGVNYRNMSSDDIEEHLNSKCRSKTNIVAIVKAFRDKDDSHVRNAIPAYEKAFPNFTYTTKI